MTDTSPDSAATEAEVEIPEADAADRGSLLVTLSDWTTTSDHKRIGRLFIGGALIGLLITAVIGVLLGIERVDGGQVVFDGAVSELFQAFRIGLVFAVMAPLGVGLALAVTPLQVGTRSAAFPRLAMVGFYAWLAGIVLVGVSLAADGGIGGTDADMVGLFMLGLGMLAAGLLAAAGSIATTVLSTRAPGMTMRRVPFFSWAALVTSIGLLLALPVMVGTLIYKFIDYRLATETAVFGGSDGIAVWLGWVFTQPTSFLFAIPALGVAAELVPVTFGRRQAVRGAVFAGLALVGVAAFAGVTQQPIFDLPWEAGEAFADRLRDLVPFALFNLVPVLGVVIVMALGALTAKPVKGASNRPRITAAFLFAFFGLGMVAVGMLGNVLYAINDLDLQGTVFEEASLVYVAYGSVLGVMGGLVYWAPKLWGRCVAEKAALPLALVGVLATVLASLPYYIAGFADQPANAAEFSYSGPDTLWNALVLSGHALMVLAVLGIIGLLISSARGDGPGAVDDPWDAHTIEWTATSPAPGNNYPDVPVITSAEPLLDLKSQAEISLTDADRSPS